MEDEQAQAESGVTQDLPAVDPPAETPAETPPDFVLEEVREYYKLLQVDYTARIAVIEKFLGFAEGVEALGTRLANLERFVGIKG